MLSFQIGHPVKWLLKLSLDDNQEYINCSLQLIENSDPNDKPVYVQFRITPCKDSEAVQNASCKLKR
jgi:hypothetical protein